nr:hypothetical protein [Acanthopleuribacter pedis]
MTDQPYYVLFLIGVAVLLLASELVVFVLAKLESHQFGVVHLGTLFTPLCTGFPNLMLGIFGQSRLSGDLVIHLNIGNNIANTTLVTGTIILLAGPLTVRVASGKSKKAVQARRDFNIALAVLWLGAALLVYLCHDGLVSRWDAAALVGCYAAYQALMLFRRGKPTKSKRLPKSLGAALLGALLGCALLISFSVDAVAAGMEGMGTLVPGASLGMLLGLLTVLPESFLLLRLTRKQGSLGLTGLVGDCLVSIPLVIGVSALIVPIPTAVLAGPWDVAARGYWMLGATMLGFSILAMQPGQISRKVGFGFCCLYALVWVWL